MQSWEGRCYQSTSGAHTAAHAELGRERGGTAITLALSRGWSEVDKSGQFRGLRNSLTTLRYRARPQAAICLVRGRGRFFSSQAHTKSKQTQEKAGENRDCFLKFMLSHSVFLQTSHSSSFSNYVK